MKSVSPDRDYCFPQGNSASTDIEDCSIVRILSEVSCIEYEKPECDISPVSLVGSERKRRRHSCGDVDCYVVHPSIQHLSQSKQDGACLLPEGRTGCEQIIFNYNKCYTGHCFSGSGWFNLALLNTSANSQGHLCISKFGLRVEI